eukprot:2797817-Rhodomonas_salina.1
MRRQAVIRAEADSDELKDAVQNSNSDQERVEVYNSFYRQHFEEVEKWDDKMKAAGAVVTAMFEQLNQVFAARQPDLERYAETCNAPYPRAAGGQGLLAVCPVSGTRCADEEGGNWVYCCCAENAMVGEEPGLDICADIKEGASEEYKEIVDEMSRQSLRRAEAGVTYYQSWEAGMRSKYGSDWDPPTY